MAKMNTLTVDVKKPVSDPAREVYKEVEDTRPPPVAVLPPRDLEAELDAQIVRADRLEAALKSANVITEESIKNV